jgi:hypothetical protein
MMQTLPEDAAWQISLTARKETHMHTRRDPEPVPTPPTEPPTEPTE